LFGFSVVLSISEMATLTRAMAEKTQNARWFASNNLFGSRSKALADCDRTEKRIAELKAMEPQHHEPNAITIPERIIEAIEQGSALCLSRLGKYNASIDDDDPNGTKICAAGRTMQEALGYLSEYLPPTMREIALMNSQPEGGRP
jgi:hypothetical protein